MLDGRRHAVGIVGDALGQALEALSRVRARGFTTGVGLKLLDAQIPELLGFNYRVFELAQMLHRPQWLHEVSWTALVAGLAVALLVTGTAKYKRFPAAIVGITIVTFVSVYVDGASSASGRCRVTSRTRAFRAFRWTSSSRSRSRLSRSACWRRSSRCSRRAPSTACCPSEDRTIPICELLGQGTANFVVGLFGGMPVGASWCALA